MVATVVIDRTSTLSATACTRLMRALTRSSLSGIDATGELSHGLRNRAGAARGWLPSASEENAASPSTGSGVRLSGMMTSRMQQPDQSFG